MKSLLSWEHEQSVRQKGYRCVAGVDEAGRGCLAGPVVAGAVIFLDMSACPDGVNDSKKLSRASRKKLYETLTSHTSILCGVGVASVEEIDQINILKASHLAMKRALEALSTPADFVLVDGLKVSLLGENHLALIGGDAISPSIAAASIIAKEYRDRLMEQFDAEYPQYGLARHKGYGTAEHLEAIQLYGISPLHRRSFAPVRQQTFAF
ncbi:MAG: ribonuclease HII [Verrucomicrobiota bacterium]